MTELRHAGGPPAADRARRRRKHWGWGYEDEQPSEREQQALAASLAQRLGFGSAELESPVPLSRCRLPAPRLSAPAPLRELCATDDHSRARHAYGSSYRDVVRGFRGEFANPPDVVAAPSDEAHLEAVLEWAIAAGAAVIPYGGGTSVAGGVEPRLHAGRYAGVVTIDLGRMDRVLEVDIVSRSARIQAGADGPSLEAQLRPHGLTLRHYPQSYTHATLGGMIATRAGGHSATRRCHIDELVESIRALTPTGAWESLRVPASGAGVSPDRLLIGSEGTLGLITEAWVRVRPRPDERAGARVSFPDFRSGASAVRELVQSELEPDQCRLLDPVEAAISGAGDGRDAVLVLGFESAAHPVQRSLELALACCAGHGGNWDRAPAAADAGSGSVAGWREAFLRAPYLRDTFVAMGVLCETFETAVTWDRFPAVHDAVLGETLAATHAGCGGLGLVSCRITHVYPDGPALYYTVLAPAQRGSELGQWDQIKRAAADAVRAGGGTITHHHAVGRDHRRWYDDQRPDRFAAALRAAKDAVDPTGVLNPGVLIDPA